MAVGQGERGLCARCLHARDVPTRRGPIYVRCALADRNAAFPKYPRLPVLRCLGFQERGRAAGEP